MVDACIGENFSGHLPDMTPLKQMLDKPTGTDIHKIKFAVKRI